MRSSGTRRWWWAVVVMACATASIAFAAVALTRQRGAEESPLTGGSPLVETSARGGPGHASADPRTVPSQSAPPASVLPDVPDTLDPDAYASATATVLYAMDPRSHDPSAYWDLMGAARDPAAAAVIPAMTQANYESALRSRIPDDYTWRRMRDSQQWSQFAVSDVWEPEYIRTKYATGEAPAGVVMRNVSGAQTVHFVDESGTDVSRTRTATVSILMVCAPLRPRCALLAVSAGVVQ